MVSHLSNWAAVPGRQEEERDHVNAKQHEVRIVVQYKSQVHPTLFSTLLPLLTSSTANNSTFPHGRTASLTTSLPSEAEFWLHFGSC